MVGALVAFDAVQSRDQITSVGQIISIELRNRWHEDATFRNLIKREGEIPPITSRQDIRTAQLAIGATFKQVDERYDPDLLGVVPPTGTRIMLVDQPLINSLLATYLQQREIFYLGKAYANDVLYPMWFKHFGPGVRGAGEAYHIGVFGKTGSGKSGLAKMLLLGYARHPEMGILIIDPQGEFSQELYGTTVGQQRLLVRQALTNLQRTPQVYNIQQIQLQGWNLFEELLVDLQFTERLGIPPRSADNSRRASQVIRNSLEGQYNQDALNNQEALETALRAVTVRQNASYIYPTRSRADELITYVGNIIDDGLENLFQTIWSPLATLFSSGQGRRLFARDCWRLGNN